MGSVKVAIRINGEYANKKNVKTVNGEIRQAENRKHLFETHGAYLQRKAKEYVKKCNLNGGSTANGVKENTVQHHYCKRILHKWEKNDVVRRQSTKNETCILYECGEIKIVNGRTTYETATHIENNISTEEKRIIVELPRIKMRILCEEMGTLEDVPDEIKMDGEKYSSETLWEALLQTGKRIYRVKDIL